MDEKDLGEQQATLMWNGHYSIQRFDNGIRLKMRGQKPVFISPDEVAGLLIDLTLHYNRWKDKVNLEEKE